MKYYTIDKKEENILLYEYKALADKLYEYKKRKMQEEKYKLLRASFALKYASDYSFKENEFNLTKSDNIDGAHHPYISYSDVDLPLEEQQEILEKFYRGNIVIGEMKSFGHPSIYNTDGALALFPKEINVKKTEHQSNSSHILYFTDDVIRVPRSIILLNSLEDGDVNHIANNIDKLDEQLECFEFSQEPIDSIKLATLKAMYDGKYINSYSHGAETEDVIDYTIKKARENKNVLQLVKNR